MRGGAHAPERVDPRRGTLSFAPLVGFVPDLGLVVQQRVAGTPSTSCCAALTAAPRHAAGPGPRGAGARPAARDRGAEPAPAAVEAELVRFGERAARISTVDPVLGRAAADLAERLLTTLDHCPPRTLESCTETASPASSCSRSAASSCSTSTTWASRTRPPTSAPSWRRCASRTSATPWRGGPARPSTSSASLAELFLDGYLAGGGTCRELPRTRWQEAVALERKALRAFARAPRSPVPRALIVEAHACLDQADGEAS